MHRMSWRFTRNETAQELGERLHTGLPAQKQQTGHDFEANIPLGVSNSPKEKNEDRSHVALSQMVDSRNTRLREMKCCPTWPRMQP